MESWLKVSVLLRPVEVEELRRRAALGGRSVSAEARMRLRESFGRVLVEPAASGSEGASAGLSSPVRAAPAPRAPAPEPSPFVFPALEPKVDETPAEVAKAVAASVPGVTFAHSLAGPAKPLSKQEQAGRKK